MVFDGSKKDSLINLQVHSENNEFIYYKSDFSFLESHKGYRPGKFHVVLGTSGGGKSTFIRSLVLDSILRNETNKKTMVWLSEETEMDFMVQFIKLLYFYKPEKQKDILNKLIVVSELDQSKYFANESQKKWIEYYYHYMGQQEIGLIYYDNITTSIFYAEKRPDEQKKYVTDLKNYITKINKPFVVVAHTSSEINQNINREINKEDIRGSKYIVLVSEFYYVLQNFKKDNYWFPSLKIEKHRGQNPKELFYFLAYDAQKNGYVGDRSISFDEFKENYLNRDKL